ncbi:hypothetical protein Tco_0164762 [Tanacetum coccineum]
MWGNNRAIVTTPGSAIIVVDLRDNFTVKGHHLSMIKDRQFDGRAQADPHKHITEFIEICEMFRYGNTNVDTIKLKVWFNELSPSVITTWEEMRQAFVSRFFPPAMFDRLMGENRGFSQHPNESLVDAWLSIQAIFDARGIFIYKTPNEAHQLPKDRVLLKLDWSKDIKSKPLWKTVAFAESSDNSQLIEKMEALTTKIDSQFKDIKGEMKEMRDGCNSYRGPHPSSESKNEHVNVIFTLSGKTYDPPVNPNAKTTIIHDDSEDEADKAKKEVESWHAQLWEVLKRSLMSNKSKMEQISAAFLNEEGSAIVQNKLLPKLVTEEELDALLDDSDPFLNTSEKINETSLDKEFKEFMVVDVDEIPEQEEEVKNNFEEWTLDGNLRIKTSIQDLPTNL